MDDCLTHLTVESHTWNTSCSWMTRSKIAPEIYQLRYVSKRYAHGPPPPCSSRLSNEHVAELLEWVVLACLVAASLSGVWLSNHSIFCFNQYSKCLSTSQGVMQTACLHPSVQHHHVTWPLQRQLHLTATAGSCGFFVHTCLEPSVQHHCNVLDHTGALCSFGCNSEIQERNA